MSKWVKADAKAWPLGYSGNDGVEFVHIPAGGAVLVSDAKAAQLQADFPGTFAEVAEKDAEKLNAPQATKPEPKAAVGKAKPEGA